MTPPPGGRFDPYGRTVPLPPAVAPRPEDVQSPHPYAHQQDGFAPPSPSTSAQAAGQQAWQDSAPEPDPDTDAHWPEDAPRTRHRWTRRSVWGETWRWVIVFAIFAGLAAAAFGGVVLYAIGRQARLDQAGPADAIVVLGTAQWNGYPGPVLRARLDHALDLYWQGLAPLVIVTGGRMQGDQYTEAEAARTYLIDMGVPPDAILLENDGRDSWESMQSVAAMAREFGLSRVLLVSDGFHLFRLKLMARDLGMEAIASPALESPIVPGGPGERVYMLREAGGVVEHLLRRFSFLWQASESVRSMFG